MASLRLSAAISTWLALASFATGVTANHRVSHLRAGAHVHRMHREPEWAPPSGEPEWSPPPAGLAPVFQTNAAPAPAVINRIADMFAKMDTNKDGKVDCREFANAQKAGVLPIAAAPSPMPGAPGAGGAPAPAPGPAPAPSPEQQELLGLVPPPLPDNIPEPPPPPRAPPAEPLPPPQPPTEGQLVGPPPSDHSMEASGTVSAIRASMPGVDLDPAPSLSLSGADPLGTPATPPPIPAPLLPPPLPQVVPSVAPFKAPPELKPAVMTPSPVAFGLDAASTFVKPEKAPLLGVSMPRLVEFSALLGATR